MSPEELQTIAIQLSWVDETFITRDGRVLVGEDCPRRQQREKRFLKELQKLIDEGLISGHGRGPKSPRSPDKWVAFNTPEMRKES